jgi:hypothetical protein
LGSIAKKAAWNSNRPLRFPKANLKIYSTAKGWRYSWISPNAIICIIRAGAFSRCPRHVPKIVAGSSAVAKPWGVACARHTIRTKDRYAMIQTPLFLEPEHSCDTYI